MLKKNNFFVFFVILFTAFFYSCDTYELPSCYVGLTLYNKDNVTSDIIKIHQIEINNIKYKDENKKETVETLENVACSLRNSNILNGDIIAFTKSGFDGNVTFCFSENQKKSKKHDAMYYLPDIAEEIDAETNGTSKFYIIINDPDLDGYDENYETIIQTCATPNIYNNLIIKLGKK